MSGPQLGDVYVIQTRAAADRLQRVIAAANRACDALDGPPITVREHGARLRILRDALVSAGMREAR